MCLGSKSAEFFEKTTILAIRDVLRALPYRHICEPITIIWGRLGLIFLNISHYSRNSLIWSLLSSGSKAWAAIAAIFQRSLPRIVIWAKNRKLVETLFGVNELVRLANYQHRPSLRSFERISAQNHNWSAQWWKNKSVNSSQSKKSGWAVWHLFNGWHLWD